MISESQFLVTFPKPGLEDLLKAEFTLRFPLQSDLNFKLSFSRPGFISFKASRPLSYDWPNQHPLIFSRCTALFLEKSTALPEGKTFAFDVEQLKDDQLNDNRSNDDQAQRKNHSSDTAYASDEGEFWIKVGKEFWKCAYRPTPLIQKLDSLFLENHSYSESCHPLPEAAPSRAYYKAMQAHQIFEIPFREGDHLVEIGSAPGGMSYYYLSLGMKVWGIDPALMSESLLNGQFKANFTHVPLNIFDVNRRDLPSKVHWVSLDLNLKSSVSFAQTLRLLELYPAGMIKGIFLTLKSPAPMDVALAMQWKPTLESLGFSEVYLTQLPSHRREFGVVALRRKAR